MPSASLTTIAALALVFTVAPSPAGAQDVRDTFRLEEVVVTPTRIPTPRAAIPASVTVLSGDDLRARGIHQVLDALRDVMGAAVVQVGGFGGLTSLFVRGGESDYVAVLLDGVPLNQPGGAVDLANLTTENLERIEIVRGPASVLYGSDAMTGVVHLITASGRGSPTVEAGVRVGAFEAALPLSASGTGPVPTNGAVVVSGRVAGGQEVSYGLSIVHAASDGLYTWDGATAFDNGYGSTAVSGQVILAPDSVTDARLAFRYGDHRYQYPTDGAGRLVDHNAVSRNRGTALALDAGRFFHSRLEGRVLLTSHVTRLGVDDQPDGPADTLGVFASESQTDTERRRAEVRGNLYLRGSSVITLGVQVEQESERGFSSFSSAFGASASDTDLERSSGAYYAQVQHSGDRGGVNAGARLEDNSAFGRFATYRAGVTYRFPWGLRLRAAAGSGFKEPTFFENFATGFVRGNPDLEPERSLSGEVGAEFSTLRGRASFGGTAFTQRFRDLIDFTFSPPSPADPNYFNIVGANASGVELEGRATLSNAWTVSAGYTYLRAMVTQGGFDQGPGSQFAPGARLLRRPAHAAVVAIGGRVSRLARLHGQVRYVGAREDRDFAVFPSPAVELARYTVLDTGAEASVARWGGSALTASFRIENAFGARVQDSYNFPSRGRTVWVGMKVGN